MDCKSFDQCLRNTRKVIILDKLIEIDRKHLKSDTKMIAPQEIILHLNAILIIMRIISPQMIQNPDFDNTLLVKSFLVPYNFKCNVFFSFMIKDLNNLSKTTLTQLLSNLKSIHNMIMRSKNIVASLIIKPMVSCLVQMVYLARFCCVHEVDLLKLLDLDLFIKTKRTLKLF